MTQANPHSCTLGSHPTDSFGLSRALAWMSARGGWARGGPWLHIVGYVDAVIAVTIMLLSGKRQDVQACCEGCQRPAKLCLCYLDSQGPWDGWLVFKVLQSWRLDV